MQRTDTIPDDYTDVHYVDDFRAIRAADYTKPQPANLFVWRRELELKIFQALAWHMREELKLGFNSQQNIDIHKMKSIAEQTHGDVHEAAGRIYEDGMAMYGRFWRPRVYIEWGEPPPASPSAPPQGIPHADGLNKPYKARLMAQYSEIATNGFRHEDVVRTEDGFAVYTSDGAAQLKQGAEPFSLGFGTISAHSEFFVHQAVFSHDPAAPPRVRTMWDCDYNF